MNFITQLAMRSRPVTILAIIMLTIISVNAYINMQRELFPEIEFPNIFVVTVYPNSNPEAIAREITAPVENSISGISGMKEIRSTSSNTSSNISVTFDFKKDLSEAETAVWLLFATFMSFQSLADFGFNSYLIRAYAHASG